MSGGPNRAPALAPGELFAYAHDNGAIFLLEADGRSRLVPLPELLDILAAAHAAGARVFAGSQGGPFAVAVLDAVAARGVPVVEFVPSQPPHTWGNGADAMIEAAGDGADRILDDLIDRGLPVDHRDVSGATALHHAAVHGNLHAISALVAAGADVDARNDAGVTPHAFARSNGHPEAEALLVTLGASLGEPSAPVRFRGHAAAYFVNALAPFVALAFLTAVLWFLHPVAAVVGFAALVAVGRRYGPTTAFRRGGFPTELDGRTLTIRGLRGARAIDLATVTCAALGGGTASGATLGARWILLATPDGAPADRSVLERLNFPPAELDAAADRFPRVDVVALAGGSGRDEVIRLVGEQFSARRTDLTASFVAQLAHARTEHEARGR